MIFFFEQKGKKLKNLGFFGESFHPQPQNKNGSPDLTLATKS